MSNIVHLRFDDTASTTRPTDVAGSLGDLDVTGALTMPAVIDGALGKARSFVPASLRGLVASDVVSGSTLLQRDMSIQVVMSWDIAVQAAAGTPGTIIARGTGASAPEYAGFGLELRVVNLASLVGELRWLWHDAGGVLKTQVGGHFQAASGFVMLTATRRWVSSTSVVLRYYLADELIAEILSTDGSIGGGTTGTTQIGTRWTGAAFAQFLAGAIDELRVVDYEMSVEEIEATYQRITVFQPRGYQLFLDMHDSGFPMSTDPGSRIQRENRMIGHALGYAAAQAENMARNLIPSRAYGPALEEWEAACNLPPGPGDSIDTRRARIVSRFRQRLGVSIPGTDGVLENLVGTDIANLQHIAFSHDITDAFASLNANRWYADPAAAWSAAGTLAVQPGAGTYIFNGVANRDWRTCITSVGGNGHGAHMFTKLVFTTPQSVGEAGIFFGDLAAGNFILLGLRDNAGSFQVVTEAYRSWISQGLTVQATPGANPAAIWLHLWAVDAQALFAPIGTSDFFAAWSTTSMLTGYTTSPVINHITNFQWAGHYIRSTGAIGAARADFDDSWVRMPKSDRTFRFYTYRNPAFPGSMDRIAAHNAMQALKHSHTEGDAITSLDVLYDDSITGYDREPMGGI